MLVDWHVVMKEGLAFELCFVLKGVGLDESPREAGLGSKVAVDWEDVAAFVHYRVNPIGPHFVKRFDFLTGLKRRDLTPVSSESWRACAIEPPVVYVTHLVTRSTILTRVG